MRACASARRSRGVAGRGSQIEIQSAVASSWALVLVASLALIACGGGGSPEGTPTAAIEDAATHAPTGIAPGGDPTVTVEQAILACREKNAGVLRSFVGADVTDAEIEALFARGRDVRLLVQAEPVLDDSTASVDVRLHIDRDAGFDEVDRSWQLVRGDDGVWRFTSLPDCY